MAQLRKNWLSHLIDFREQGMRISDINPVAALADIICEQLYAGEINRNDLNATLEQISSDLWARQRQHLRLQTERGDFIVLRRGDLILENVFGRHRRFRECDIVHGFSPL